MSIVASLRLLLPWNGSATSSSSVVARVPVRQPRRLAKSNSSNANTQVVRNLPPVDKVSLVFSAPLRMILQRNVEANSSNFLTKQFALFSHVHRTTFFNNPTLAVGLVSANLHTSAKAPQPSTGGQSPFVLQAKAHMIPHPEKAYKGGEDAYFISSDGMALGVADGVGGWADHGVDPGLYSKSLMKETMSAYQKWSTDATDSNKGADPVSILQTGWEKVKNVLGSSTACVLVLHYDQASNKMQLRTANIGDSGFMIIRSGKVFFRTKEQQHDFNFPYQIGTESSDTPQSADRATLNVEEGDVIVVGTDGLFDNVFDETIVDLVSSSLSSASATDVNAQLEKAAKAIATTAHKLAADPRYRSPFAVNALKNRRMFLGGKMDDITVIVARVTAQKQQQPSAKL